MSYNPYGPCPQPWHPQPWQPLTQPSSAPPPPTKPPGLSTGQAIGIALGAWLLFWTVIGGCYLAAVGASIRLPAVIESESYRQGYAQVQGAQDSDWHGLKAQGWTAATACAVSEGLQHPQPQSAGDWIRGCTDALHNKGIRP